MALPACWTGWAARGNRRKHRREPTRVSFYEVAVALLVPPIPLVLIALFGLALEHRYHRTGRLFAWFGVVGLLVMALPMTSGLLLDRLERNLPLSPPTDEPPQAIVILGGDIMHGPGHPPITHIGLLSLERVRAGATLYRRTQLPILVTGGKLHASETPIAELMADSLEHDFHVPVRWVEAESRDTWQNGRLSAAILRTQGIRSVYLVTQPWHMRRAALAFTDAGLTVTAAPTPLDRSPQLSLKDFVPVAGSWQTTYFAMHEWIGWAWYSVR